MHILLPQVAGPAFRQRHTAMIVFEFGFRCVLLRTIRKTIRYSNDGALRRLDDHQIWMSLQGEYCHRYRVVLGTQVAVQVSRAGVLRVGGAVPMTLHIQARAGGGIPSG